ncbi:testis-specific serine/threonine-protein kinase 1-like [Boleophthalmus pectinirostris]|uniref:testis-specific serine/threonine-protein kinase 1-like n=1 Tax=Boleophthalmus pectinirostris TaxID=150288 RepID=UPI0024300AA5|nr:testis-specific serine/threonine-protein kinase 1-like [Boleophthalmus pectinirostris]
MSLGLKDKLFMEKHGFTFQKILGEGQYGKVVKASSNRMRQDFAVKIIDRKNAEPIYLEKFLPRELEIMKCLKHPNVIKTFCVFKGSGSKVFVVTELCDIGDLSKHIKAKGPLSEEFSKRVFVQLCDAVQYLHGIGIVHRDLKCENLVLDRNNNIKVCDFSLSKRLSYTDGQPDLSKTCCGTSNYIAPEILRSLAYNPVVTDVWSMGVILFKMLYDAFPFSSTRALKMAHVKMTRHINFPDTPHVSLEAVELILHTSPKRGASDQHPPHPGGSVDDAGRAGRGRRRVFRSKTRREDWRR